MHYSAMRIFCQGLLDVLGRGHIASGPCGHQYEVRRCWVKSPREVLFLCYHCRRQLSANGLLAHLY